MKPIAAIKSCTFGSAFHGAIAASRNASSFGFRFTRIAKAVARLKAPIIWAEMIEAWEAKLAGDTSDADGRITAAKNLAAKRGYRYLPVASVAQLPMTELLDRAERIVTPSGKVDLIEADALLGLLGEPEVTVTKALEQYWTIARAKTLG